MNDVFTETSVIINGKFRETTKIMNDIEKLRCGNERCNYGNVSVLVKVVFGEREELMLRTSKT